MAFLSARVDNGCWMGVCALLRSLFILCLLCNPCSLHIHLNDTVWEREGDSSQRRRWVISFEFSFPWLPTYFSPVSRILFHIDTRARYWCKLAKTGIKIEFPMLQNSLLEEMPRTLEKYSIPFIMRSLGNGKQQHILIMIFSYTNTHTHTNLRDYYDHLSYRIVIFRLSQAMHALSFLGGCFLI